MPEFLKSLSHPTPNVLAVTLAFNNFVSAGIAFLGTIVLTSVFGVENIGLLGLMVSATMIVSPLVQFRLDLAFERLEPEKRPGLVALVQTWALLVGVFTLCVGLVVAFFLDGDYASVIPFIGVNIVAANCSNIVWSRKVCERNILAIFALQVVRALLGVAAPLLLINVLEAKSALMVGLCLSNMTFVFFLPGIQNYAWASLKKSYRMVRTRCSDLLLDNTIPVLINLASVYLAPVVVTVVFGAAETGVIYLLFRLLLTPAQLLADPIRRSTYARFSDRNRLTLQGVQSISLFSLAFFVMGCLGIALCIVFQNVFLGMLSETYWSYYMALVLSAFWGGMVIGNAPLTGLIPVLGISRMQSIVEMIGFGWRVGSITLGFLGFSFLQCLYLFICGTIFINIFWGIVLIFVCRRIVERS